MHNRLDALGIIFSEELAITDKFLQVDPSCVHHSSYAICVTLHTRNFSEELLFVVIDLLGFFFILSFKAIDLQLNFHRLVLDVQELHFDFAIVIEDVVGEGRKRALVADQAWDLKFLLHFVTDFFVEFFAQLVHRGGSPIVTVASSFFTLLLNLLVNVVSKLAVHCIPGSFQRLTLHVT